MARQRPALAVQPPADDVSFQTADRVANRALVELTASSSSESSPSFAREVLRRAPPTICVGCGPGSCGCAHLALNLSRCEKAIRAAVKLVELALAARNDAARLARDS